MDRLILALTNGDVETIQACVAYFQALNQIPDGLDKLVRVLPAATADNQDGKLKNLVRWLGTLVKKPALENHIRFRLAWFVVSHAVSGDESLAWDMLFICLKATLIRESLPSSHADTDAIVRCCTPILKLVGTHIFTDAVLQQSRKIMDSVALVSLQSLFVESASPFALQHDWPFYFISQLERQHKDGQIDATLLSQGIDFISLLLELDVMAAPAWKQWSYLMRLHLVSDLSEAQQSSIDTIAMRLRLKFFKTVPDEKELSELFQLVVAFMDHYVATSFCAVEPTRLFLPFLSHRFPNDFKDAVVQKLDVLVEHVPWPEVCEWPGSAMDYKLPQSILLTFSRGE
jgi:hypothetical protein